MTIVWRRRLQNQWGGNGSKHDRTKRLCSKIRSFCQRKGPTSFKTRDSANVTSVTSIHILPPCLHSGEVGKLGKTSSSVFTDMYVH